MSRTCQNTRELTAAGPLTWKSGMDFVLAFVLMVLTAPIICLAMVLVRLTSRGAAIYSQERLGLDGRCFTIYKIRTMYRDCESSTGPRWSTPGDPRVTAIGRVLRATHIDELPQLINILRGEMSLVGPRPERPEIAVGLEIAIPRYRERLHVRPGVTGLAQVQLPPDTDLNSVRRKVMLDLYYIEQSSLWLDIRLILATVLGIAGMPASRITSLLAIADSSAVESVSRDRSGKPDIVSSVSVASHQPIWPEHAAVSGVKQGASMLYDV